MILEEDILKYSEAVERIMNNKELSLSEKSCLTYLLLLETEISVKGIILLRMLQKFYCL